MTDYAEPDGRSAGLMSNLFQIGAFSLASGKQSNFKIECDALTDPDWNALAQLVQHAAAPFGEVIGVPRGGLPLAARLKPTEGPRLVVDDVLTTGGSIRRLMTRPTDRGFVVFARGTLPTNVGALFRMENE